MAIKLTPQEYAQKWARRLAGATEDIRRGVERVTESPMEKALEKKDKFVAQFNRAIQDGKWDRGLRRVSLPDWKDKTLNVGVARIAGGVAAAEDGMADFAGDLITHINSGTAEIERMPDITPEQRDQRALAMIRHMRTFRRG